MLEPTAEEIALAAFRWERDAARDWQRYARTAARRAKDAEMFSIRILRLHKADKWQQVASLHRHNVSILARIIRAIRAEKEETDTTPQPRVK